MSSIKQELQSLREEIQKLKKNFKNFIEKQKKPNKKVKEFKKEQDILFLTLDEHIHGIISSAEDHGNESSITTTKTSTSITQWAKVRKKVKFSAAKAKICTTSARGPKGCNFIAPLTLMQTSFIVF